MLKFMKSLEKAGGHMPHGQSVRVQPVTLCCVSFPSIMLFFLKDKTKYNISAVEWHKAELKDLLPTLVFTDIISGQS